MERLLHTPEGVRDIYNHECEVKLQIESKLHQVMSRYGYQDIQTPTFEFFEVFSEERGTVASKDMYKFFDRAGNTLVLRPDITPSIARCFAKYYKNEDCPVRLCYGGSTFINNNEYQGKMKEVFQLGAELLNDASVEADAELIALTVECLQEVGLKEFQVEIGHTGFFRALVEEACLNEEDTEQLRLLIMNKNRFGVEALLSEKAMDQSLKEAFTTLPELFGNVSRLEEIKNVTKTIKAVKTIERLEEMYHLLEVYGYDKYVTFDLGTLSQYNYYTGMIFHAYTYGTGNPIVTGGRYDSLVRQFGKDAPAVGMAILTTQLQTAMARQKTEVLTQKERELVIYSQNGFQEAVRFAQMKRHQGIDCMMCRIDDIVDRSALKAYASRVGACCIRIINYGGSMETITRWEV